MKRIRKLFGQPKITLFGKKTFTDLKMNIPLEMPVMKTPSSWGRQCMCAHNFGPPACLTTGRTCPAVAESDCSRVTLDFTPFMHRSCAAGLSGLCRVTDHLYLSNCRAANDPSQVARYEITCIVNVTETKSSSPARPGVEYIHIPVPDSPVSPLSDHFDDVADKVQQVAESGGRTLVHCNAGVSRSAALCMVYLMKHRGVTLLEAHRWLRTCRPMVRPNSGFWKQLIRYEMELRGCSSVRMVLTSMGEIPDIYEEEARNMMPL